MAAGAGQQGSDDAGDAVPPTVHRLVKRAARQFDLVSGNPPRHRMDIAVRYGVLAVRTMVDQMLRRVGDGEAEEEAAVYRMLADHLARELELPEAAVFRAVVDLCAGPDPHALTAGLPPVDQRIVADLRTSVLLITVRYSAPRARPVTRTVAAVSNAAVSNAPEPACPEFALRKPRRDLAGLVVPDGVRQRLETAIRLVKYHDVLFNKWDLKSIDPRRQGVALNLYGPPGTGKTLAAEALAAHLGRGFIDVSYAEIESRYVGETPKNIVRCFAAAQRHDAVLVFNEADSILGSWLSTVTQSADHSVNVSRAVMLAQLDEFTGIVVFNSNFPRNYDTAFFRRILAHVRFDLPDQPTRRRLWAALLPKLLPLAADVDLGRLAEASDGLAGGDLVNIILAAAAKAVDRPVQDCCVHLADLLDEITELREAKREIGKPRTAEPIVTWDPAASLSS